MGTTVAWRSVLLATAVSVVGDNIARVAIALLVFERSGSAALTALTYGLTLAPELLGGVVLGGIAGRMARRTVLATTSAVQAVLVAAIAVPGLPLAVIALAVAGVSLCAAPARAAQSAVAYDLLGDARVGAGQAVLTILFELGQVVGLAAGAAVVATIGVPAAVLADAASFLVAALAVWWGLAGVVEPDRRRDAASKTDHGTRAAWRVVTRDAVLRNISVLVLLVSWVTVPSAIMAPLVMQLHAPPSWVGILLAADCAGVIAGSALVQRVPVARQPALIGPMLIATYLPFVAVLIAPSVWWVGALLLLSGAAQAYLPLTKGIFSVRIGRVAPAAALAAFGLVGTAVQAAQGLTAIIGGAIATLLGSPTLTIGIVGAASTAQAIVAAYRWHRTHRQIAGTSTAGEAAA